MDEDSPDDRVQRLATLTAQGYSQQFRLEELPKVLDCLCVFYDYLEPHQFSFPSHYFWWVPSYKKTGMGPEGAGFPGSTRGRQSNDNALTHHCC